MAFPAQIYASLRQGARPQNLSPGNFSVTANVGGELNVNQTLPERTEIVRLGRSYLVQIAVANAFTYVAGLPTTRAELIVYNNAQAASNICLVIDRAFMYGVTSMAAAQPIALAVQNCAPGLVAAPSDGTTTVIQTSLSNKNAGLTRVGNALFALANTAFCVAGHWEIVAQANAPMTTNLGQSVTASLYGSYVVAPTGAFGLAGIAGTAAGTAVIGVVYHEVYTDLGV